MWNLVTKKRAKIAMTSWLSQDCVTTFHCLSITQLWTHRFSRSKNPVSSDEYIVTKSGSTAWTPSFAHYQLIISHVHVNHSRPQWQLTRTTNHWVQPIMMRQLWLTSGVTRPRKSFTMLLRSWQHSCSQWQLHISYIHCEQTIRWSTLTIHLDYIINYIHFSLFILKLFIWKYEWDYKGS